MAKHFSYVYCVLTLFMTSDRTGVSLDFHLEDILSFAAISICVSRALYLFWTEYTPKLRIANCGVGILASPVTLLIRENTPFQKLFTALQFHSMCRI